MMIASMLFVVRGTVVHEWLCWLCHTIRQHKVCNTRWRIWRSENAGGRGKTRICFDLHRSQRVIGTSHLVAPKVVTAFHLMFIKGEEEKKRQRAPARAFWRRYLICF
jgi:hypothetical protein